MFRLAGGSGLRRKTDGVLKNYARRKYSAENNLPKQADVVIVGGGVIGCNILYTLSKRGVNAVLLEGNKITSGTTWHTGGLVWSLRPNDVDIQILQTTRNQFKTLEKETGLDPGWINTGGIFIARTKERLEEYKRLHTLGHYFNVESRLISPSEAAQLSSILNPSSFIGALYSPADGFADPTMYCNALIKAAKTNGGLVFENCRVTGFDLEHRPEVRKVNGVETTSGPIKTSTVINAAGVWGRQIAELAGVAIPLTPMKHSYVVTGTIPEAKGMPCIRDHDGGLYIRSQGDSVLFGGYENNPEIIKELPNDFQFSLFELDKSIFDTHWKHGVELCPSFEKAGIKSDVCGPESFTPDHKPLMGEDPKVIGLFHACGFNSLGVQFSGGVGEEMAEWVTKGRPNLPMYQYDIRRFTPIQREDKAWGIETSHECYAKTYSIVYPHDQPLAGRNHRIDAFQEALVAAGAVMEQAAGWERPGYFVKDRTAPVRGYDWYGHYDHVDNKDKRYERELEGDYSFEFSKHHDLIKDEAMAARNNVALFDLTCYTKMYLTGKDAEQVADWLFTANIDKEPGKVVYTCSLNSKGGVESDVTVTPLQEGGGTLVGPILKGKGYYIVAGSASGYQTLSHFRREVARRGFKSVFNDTTDRLGILSIQGPKSGELLQSITEFPITDEKIPFGMSQVIKIAGHTCRVMRMSYIGELGYEIHIPLASCVPIYNKISDAGRGFDLKHAGFRALESLSLEKGYHLLNHDLRIDDTPVEAGLLHVCRKDGQYMGKQQVEKAKQTGVRKRRVFFTVDEPVALYGLETIWRDDAIVGYLRRGDYGFSLDSSIGIGYVRHPKGYIVDNEFLRSGDYQIEVRNKKYPATLYLKSPFDPKSMRLRGIYDNEFEEQTHFED